MTWLEKIINPLSFSKTVRINGKPLCIEWTNRADSALRKRKYPLNIEMELYFSGMIKKMVIFHDSPKNKIEQDKLHSITRQMKVWFHPVTSGVFKMGDAPHQQSMIDVEIINLHNYYPKKLNIDFRNDRWEGHFL
ncbi:MAG: hypothetical protein KZQ64_16130 [gamma proteobacterium symbiont of Bathyaustriella thionipta]|nr:hypothetical protein [gamma proteobacterium symbiont of Bathyaustriella thionipta]MCU7951471.1 hypothetical protein [gamma proteobacterium symbiont of Bathyaustriella thionipta]MCU7954896.1 hypothetical protein [gamma proteobacterium symbiont of Bathyaustriella thionipta]MCU7958039.1 hypothetical protein [gamma proteobacterium symbiont of Bathyaustriella thionipta]MCU7968684.1 hypothetical protein [gamma proteobacterium symbiont of Bathyaustriella thionipta]